MQLLASPRATYAAASAVFTGLQTVVLLVVPVFLGKTLEPGGDGPNSAETLMLRAIALPLAYLTYHQGMLSTGNLASSPTANFYTWFASITLQLLLFVTSYVRYIEPRPAYASLGTLGSLAWGSLLVSAGGLASSGIWCLLFAPEGEGESHGKIRSSGWLFPSKDKRAAKVEKREKRYGKAAIK